MATAKKKAAPVKKAAPAKKSAPAKKAAPAKKPVSKKPAGEENGNEYFIKNQKAYVRVASGDIFGPYPLRSAAGRTALGSEVAGAIGRAASTLRGGGGLLNRGK